MCILHVNMNRLVLAGIEESTFQTFVIFRAYLYVFPDFVNASP